jgi:hypothetical protein
VSPHVPFHRAGEGRGELSLLFHAALKVTENLRSHPHKYNISPEKAAAVMQERLNESPDLAAWGCILPEAQLPRANTRRRQRFSTTSTPPPTATAATAALPSLEQHRGILHSTLVTWLFQPPTVLTFIAASCVLIFCQEEFPFLALACMAISTAVASGTAQNSTGPASFDVCDRTILPVAAAANPEGLERFVGGWKQVHSEGYPSFLAEAVGMPWAMRKIAERTVPTPTFSVRGGALSCVTRCLGGKDVHELLVQGETTLYEPNLRVEYAVSSKWEGDCFVSSRQCDKINGGQPTVQRRWIEPSTASAANVEEELHVTQEWGGTCCYKTRYVRLH